MTGVDASLKDQIAAALREFGFAVVLLEERSDEKTPDLLATKSDERYLIEIKTKKDDAASRARERAVLAAGEISTRTEYWGPKNTVARIVRDGVRQLRVYPEDERDFCLLWLHADGTDKESQWQQFFATVYGTTNILDLRDREFKVESLRGWCRRSSRT